MGQLFSRGILDFFNISTVAMEFCGKTPARALLYPLPGQYKFRR